MRNSSALSDLAPIGPPRASVALSLPSLRRVGDEQFRTITKLDTAERHRLAASASGAADWQRWGTYVSDRAWGTVREDYSANGDAWTYFPHEHARSRAYRWNEDGLAGFCDRQEHLCLGIALWNERDPILKERLFGLSNQEGNHGEDVKEYFFYLDNTPTHSYARMVYKYPHVEFPYAALVDENARRGTHDPEFELIDAIGDAFREQRYFDVFVEYAKRDTEDVLCRIQVINRGPDAAPIHVLPHLWYRNTWSWDHGMTRHAIHAVGVRAAATEHDVLGHRSWYVEAADGAEPELLFTENDTNVERLFGAPSSTALVKDGINDAVVHGRRASVSDSRGSKAAAHFHAVVAPGATYTVRVRLSPSPQARPFAGFDSTIARRQREADAFYASVHAAHLTEDERLAGRNHDWALHFHNADVILMPDKWEYPWYASWDLAFHVVVMAAIDPQFAKEQILLLLQPRTQHPYGSVPAFEWDFNAVNPPLLAWAVWQVYHLDRIARGEADHAFLENTFDGLLLMLGWWVNRKDSEGNGIFGGGFLGLDNIGIFDRDRPLPTGGALEQSDGTGWMAMFQLNMASIALELAGHDARYQPFVHRFGQHFVMVSHVLQKTAAGGAGLWSEEDRFYFDVIRHGSTRLPLKIYSMVGLVPLFAAAVINGSMREQLPVLAGEIAQAFENRRFLRTLLPNWVEPGEGGTRLLSVVDRERLEHLLRRVLDETEFLSEYGIRSLSLRHRDDPYQFSVAGQQYEVAYLPGVSDNRVFGGNSNWRGPIWFPMNFLLIQAIATFARYYGDSIKLECPQGSGRELTLQQIADELAGRLTRLFVRDPARDGRRAVLGDNDLFQSDEHWRDHIPFCEFFHADSGLGLGASHQTGWTALVALLLQHGGDLCFDRKRTVASDPGWVGDCGQTAVVGLHTGDAVAVAAKSR